MEVLYKFNKKSPVMYHLWAWSLNCLKKVVKDWEGKKKNIRRLTNFKF